MAKHYNRLPSTDHVEWLKEHRPTNRRVYYRSERCVRAEGKHFKVRKTGEEEVAEVAGDGNYGFPTRRTVSVKMVVGVDGGYVKSKKSVARRRKNVCRLVSKRDMKLPPQPEEKRKERKRNRNRKAARGLAKSKAVK